MYFEQTADSDTVLTYQVSSVQLVTDNPLASCRSPTALKRPDRSKQCDCLQLTDSSLEKYLNHFLFF